MNKKNKNIIKYLSNKIISSKKITVSALAFVLSSFCHAATFDIEVPLTINFAKTQIESEYNYADTYFLMFPFTVFKPIKIEYVFNCEPENSKNTPWSFSAGGAVSLWPYQFIGIGGKAEYMLKVFENNSSISFSSSLDIGFTSKISSIFDVDQVKRISKFSAGPGADLSLQLLYRTNNKFSGYFGFGPTVSTLLLNNALYYFYGFDFTFGLRLIS